MLSEEHVTVSEILGSMWKALGRSVKLRHDREKGVNLAALYALLCEVSKWLGWLLYFLP